MRGPWRAWGVSLIGALFAAHLGQNLEEGYVWLDWFSIPQLTMRKSGEETDMEVRVQHAIWSIPAYVDAANIFLVLCPPAQHVDTKEPCSAQLGCGGCNPRPHSGHTLLGVRFALEPSLHHWEGVPG